MSYDLGVYVSAALSPTELIAAVGSTSGLSIGESWAGGASSVEVLRGARRRYCFTIDGPSRVEPEDVPDEVAAVVLGASFLYEVMVEGSAGTELPHAIRFARNLARSLDGAVVDGQIDEVWSRSQSRVLKRPARQQRVNVVDVDFYCLRDLVGPEAATLFVETAKRFFPEALPRRFGEYEPLQGKLVDAGTEGFSTAWHAATSMLHFTASAPCVSGLLYAGKNERFPDQFWKMGVTVFAEPLQDPRWRDALRRFTTALADELPAFFASAQVARDHIWSGRSLWADGLTEPKISPLRARQGWLGLPPSPTWWSWFGPPYRELVASHLAPDRITQTRTGVFYEAAASTASAEDLERAAINWLPPVLLANRAPNPRRVQPVPLAPAEVIPSQLSG